MISQRYDKDCGVATIANFLNKSYDNVMRTIETHLKRSEPIEYMNNEEIALILDLYRIKPTQIFTLVHEIPAIVCVPSLATKKKFHYIYFDGRNFHDPANGERYIDNDFVEDFPVIDAIVDSADLLNKEVILPSHLFNEFDFEYIRFRNES